MPYCIHYLLNIQFQEVINLLTVVPSFRRVEEKKMASDAEKEGKQAKSCEAIWIRFDMDSIRFDSIRIETNHHSNCFAVRGDRGTTIKSIR